MTRPCPFCGSLGQSMHYDGVSCPSRPTWAVVCDECGTHGPLARSREQARKDWMQGPDAGPASKHIPPGSVCYVCQDRAATAIVRLVYRTDANPFDTTLVVLGACEPCAFVLGERLAGLVRLGRASGADG